MSDVYKIAKVTSTTRISRESVKVLVLFELSRKNFKWRIAEIMH